MQTLIAPRLRSRTIALIAVEHVLIVIAVAVAVVVRFGWLDANLLGDPGILWRASLIGAVLQVCLHYGDLYDLRTLNDRRGTVVALIQALGAASLLLALVYYWIPSLIIGRGVIVIASIMIVVLVAGWRIAFDWLALTVGPSERLLIVGTSQASVDLARELFSRRQELGVELVGFVDPDPLKVGSPLINPGIIGTVEQIPDIVLERRVDRVVVSLADARGKLPMDVLLHMKLTTGVQFDHLASVYEEYTGKIAVENLRPSWLIFSHGFARAVSSPRASA
jgi:FlaA1/EpsC-like NDP-sugar epimerase